MIEQETRDADGHVVQLVVKLPDTLDAEGCVRVLVALAREHERMRRERELTEQRRSQA